MDLDGWEGGEELGEVGRGKSLFRICCIKISIFSHTHIYKHICGILNIFCFIIFILNKVHFAQKPMVENSLP